MPERSYVFKNTAEYINNDVVLPGYPFILKGYSYHFWIHPKTSFWRFGIRLSKTQQIDFYHPQHRYKSPDFQENYIDIHLGVGDWDNQNWSSPRKIQLCQYNIVSEEHILEQSESYQERGEVEWRIQKNSETDELDISFVAATNISIVRTVKISDEFKYFKIFAWSDATEFELQTQLEIASLQEYIDYDPQLTAIQVGNIIFREGDMFDSDAIRNTTLLLLPASSDGSASSNILNRASELGIPYPVKNEPGNVLVHKVIYDKTLLAGYAYSVDETSSSIHIITEITKYLASHEAVDRFGSAIRAINIPLLGTGAGGLKPLDVAKIYDEEFNKTLGAREVIISIPNEKIFQEIKESFIGKYIAVKQNISKPKPDSIILLEKDLGTELSTYAYKINESNTVTYLNLNNYKISATSLLDFPDLEILSLNNSQVSDILKLSKLKKLHTLYFSGNRNSDYGFVRQLRNLATLDLSFNNLEEVDFLEPLKKLKALYLKGNALKNIIPIFDLHRLEILDISENNISELGLLSRLNKLENLNLSKNKVSTLLALVDLQKLRILDISDNRVENINYIMELEGLEYLKADKNPFVETLSLKLAENENHLPPIKNLLFRQAEDGNVLLTLPAKILLLGNHASGKSSLLGYIQNKHLRTSTQSTHIIKIEKYPKKSSQMPLAIFFDFGGQDYYHGIYRAFLSSGSVYLILWNQQFDNNNQRIDANGTLTQDFSCNYWLSQKSYLENEKYKGQIDPVLLIQTYADKDKRRSFHDPLIQHEIVNEFFVSLEVTPMQLEGDADHILNEQALEYLNTSVLDLIKKKQIVRYEPTWYVNFLLYILNQDTSAGYIAKNVKTEVLQHYQTGGDSRLDSLQIDLDQLHQQGLILYYKNELPDIVWLDPAALAKYVHDTVLSKDSVKGGRVSFNAFIAHDQEVLKLLHLQKVIFLHEFGDNGQEYIIPNFLPLTTDDSTFDLYTFGFSQPAFTLKFRNFLPFGLINQIICFFGRQQDKKKFWRDQLLFTLEGKAKVLIHLNFQALEIKVFIAYQKNINDKEKESIKKYIFYGILGLYWDVDLLDYPDFVAYQNNEIKKEELVEEHRLFNKIEQYNNLYQNSACRPVDMYISIDQKHYVKYPDLCNEGNTVSINAIQLDDQNNFTDTNKSIPIYPFQLFTNRVLKRRLKVAISYSKKDLLLVNKFRDYLVPLYEDELIEAPWYCTELIAGREWDEEIKRRFDEADIIFFMISENLMATKYVKENEIKNAIDKWNASKTIKIIPILLVHYHFARTGPYNLSKFVAFPYTLKPVTDFPDQNLAWHSISESIRTMIEYDWDPGANDGALTSEQKSIYERIIGNNIK